MISISLCMIVKNEEHCLQNCLNSVKEVADEIIIVDTGSTDNTVEVAKKYTNNIYFFDWINDFSAARNFSFSFASKKYILWLDADDVLLDADIKKIKDLKTKLDKSIDYVGMMYDYSFNDKGECIYSFRRNRLIKNNKGYYWDCFMHERLNVWGRQEDYDIHITHTRKHDNNSKYVENFEKRIKAGFQLNPRECFYYGGELFCGGHYDECIGILEDFLSKNYDGIYELQRTLNYLAEAYYIKKDYKKALEYFLKAFLYDLPNEEVCYRIGNCFQELKRYEDAIFWYKIVTEQEFPANSLCKKDTGWKHYLPYQQLCVCYFYLGQCELANEYNNVALKYIPNDEIALANKEYFISIGIQEEE
jgi:glycosyltransferase involved in cell wall biosynthesis